MRNISKNKSILTHFSSENVKIILLWTAKFEFVLDFIFCE